MRELTGRFGDVITEHRNSEGELATIERAKAEAFEGTLLLCFYDEESIHVAPMLLDESTVTWLRSNLPDCKHERATFDRMLDHDRQVYACDGCGWKHFTMVDPVTGDMLNVGVS